MSVRPRISKSQRINGEPHPLPNIFQFRVFGKRQYFTILDLSLDCHQIQINLKDVQKIALTVEK